jgi:hypothetical protein
MEQMFIHPGELPPEQLRVAVASVLYRLPNDHVQILRARFGIDSVSLSIANTSKQLKVSRLQIRQAEARVMLMLHHPAQQKLLQSIAITQQAQGSKNIEVRALVESVRKLTPALINHLKNNYSDLLSVHWSVFEQLLAELLASAGFVDVQLVGRNPNTAADIYAAWHVGPLGTKVRYFVEAKRWKNRVGVEVVDRVYGAMLLERPSFGCHSALIVSAVGFKDFKKYSSTHLRNMGIELASENELKRWLENYKPDSNGLWLPS